jgi:hypothetical protein
MPYWHNNLTKHKHPAIGSLWLSAREHFIPFPDHDAETRKAVCSTNAIRMPERALPQVDPGARALPWASRPRSNASTRPRARSTRPAGARYDVGRTMETRPQRVRFPPSPTAGRTARNNNENHQLHT